MSDVAPAAERRILPAPVAVTGPETVMVPARVERIMCAAAALFTKPAAEMVISSASSITKLPEVRLIAVREPTEVSISAAPVLPIPDEASRAARPVVTSRAASPGAVISVIAAPAVRVRLPLPDDTVAPRAMSVKAESVIAPVVEAVTTASTVRLPAATSRLTWAPAARLTTPVPFTINVSVSWI